MNKPKKSKKNDAGLLANAGKFANRNRRALGIAGAGLGAGIAAGAALLLGRRYRGQREATR
jgi:hypothetical protein